VEPARDSLRDLLTDVVHARVALRGQQRHQPTVRIDLGLAQHRLVTALRAYQIALSRDGAPMPYKLRDELRLLEALDEGGR
jgi:hypothetical protein